MAITCGTKMLIARACINIFYSFYTKLVVYYNFGKAKNGMDSLAA